MDGSSNKNGRGAGLILQGPEGFIVEYALRFTFKASNNEAEYEALISRLKLPELLKVEFWATCNDSQLVIGQVTGEYEAKDHRMIRYLERAKALISKLQWFVLSQIPREQNAKADSLSRLASADLMGAPQIVYMEILKNPSIKDEGVMDLYDQPSWMDPILVYLRDDKSPQDKAQARSIVAKVAKYAIIEGELYKRPFSTTYLRCLHPSEAQYALAEVH